jgi:hypothetical protein
MKVNRDDGTKRGDRRRGVNPGLRAAGVPWREVAGKLGISKRTLYREIGGKR